VSHSSKDKAHLARLRVHLAPLDRDRLVDYWDDEKRLQAGARWKAEIARAIAEARVAVLLISADFYASEFIAKDELPPLLAKNARGTLEVLAVILSQSRFERDPVLSRYQTINPPSRPLASLRPSQRESIWDKLAKQVESVVTLQAAGRGVQLIDRLEPQIMAVVQGGTGRPTRHAVMVKPVGKAIVGTVRGHPERRRAVTAADLDRLPRAELRRVRAYEKSMQEHYARWERLYPQRDDPRVQPQLRRAVRAMKRDLSGIVTFLQDRGLDLQDHYAGIRMVVQSA
jgi:hypothetical protein